jgi:hypothetical protein
MKPLHIGLLILVGAMGGALIMKLTQGSQPAPAPIANVAPAPAPVAPVEAPPATEPPPAIEPTPAPIPQKPTPMPKVSARVVAKPAHHPVRNYEAAAEPDRSVHVTVARNEPPPPPDPQLEQAPQPQPATAQPAAAPVQQAPIPAEVEAAPGPSSAPQEAAGLAADPAPAPAPSVTLRAGMLVSVRLGQGLSSEHNQSGDTFTATLDAPLVLDGFVIAERGARVEGRVVESQHAALGVELTTLNTSDGQRVGIRTETFRKAASRSTNEDVAIVAGGAAIGAAIGAMAGGGKGAAIGAAAGGLAGAGGAAATRPRSVALPAETKISFRVREPVTITEQVNR